MLDADGNGAANLTVTLNFANGGSDTIATTAAMQDWFNGSNSAIIGYSRINRGSDAYDTTDGSNPNMYETDITVPVADQGDLVQSITFTQTGQAGGTTTTGIFAVSGLTVTATPAQYANNVSVTGNSTINVSNTATAAMGTLAIGSNTLAIASANTTGGAYSLTFGAATLSGNPTFNIANSSGGGPGTLILGAINDGGTARTITLTGGNLTLDSAATSLVQGTVVEHHRRHVELQQCHGARQSGDRECRRQFRRQRHVRRRRRANHQRVGYARTRADRYGEPGLRRRADHRKHR